MYHALQVAVVVFLGLLQYTPQAFCQNLEQELYNLEDQYEIFSDCINNKELIVLPESVQYSLGLNPVVHYQVLSSRVLEYIMSGQEVYIDQNQNLSYLQESDRISNIIGYCVNFSESAKRDMRQKIPEISARIREIKQTLAPQKPWIPDPPPSSFSPSPYDCGAILTKEYKASLYNQHVKSKLGRWKNMRWGQYSVGAEANNLQRMPKYEANISVWLGRVNCIDSCVSREFKYELDWSKCRARCYTPYKECKEY